MKLPRLGLRLLDHYYVELGDGSLAVITGNAHFCYGFIGYVKYTPTSRATLWSRNGVFYERVVKKYTPREVHEHAERRIYVPYFDFAVPYIPLHAIKRIYDPLERARELYSRIRDPLEALTLELISVISVNTGVLAGVTGSLLPSIHNAELSDIDLVVYGARESVKIVEFIESNKSVFKPFTGSKLRVWSENVAATTGLPPREVIKFYRNWRRGVYANREYSIIYNDGVYRELALLPSFKTLGAVHLLVEVAGGLEALNYPSTSRVINYRVLYSEAQTIPFDVTSITSYEALYTPGLYEGGFFEVRGVLQCSNKLGECRVLAGVLEERSFMRYREC